MVKVLCKSEENPRGESTPSFDQRTEATYRRCTRRPDNKRLGNGVVRDGNIEVQLRSTWHSRLCWTSRTNAET